MRKKQGAGRLVALLLSVSMLLSILPLSSVAVFAQSDSRAASSSAGQQNTQFPVRVLQKTGSDAENLVLVFMAEGYTASQQGDFIKDSQAALQDVLTYEPYRSMADRINAYAVEVASKDSGLTEDSLNRDTKVSIPVQRILRRRIPV